MKIAIIGGGAAGFFAAIACAEAEPSAQIVILERGRQVLEKVRISGGGRCNVTTSISEPRELIKNYPRGARELLGPFSRFGPADVFRWFEQRGVRLKTEADGRVFPASDDSSDIVRCLLQSAERAGVQIWTSSRAERVQPTPENNGWIVQLAGAPKPLVFQKILFAPGASSSAWQLLEGLGHRIVAPAPSLFTFNVRDARLAGLAGLSVGKATASVEGERLSAEGPILVTHWGLSGPCILRLSAFGARFFNEKNYRFRFRINWLGSFSTEAAMAVFLKTKAEHGKKNVASGSLFGLPSRLWARLIQAALSMDFEKIGSPRWADLSKKQLESMAAELVSSVFEANGKGVFKEEFVTAGGVDLRQIDFRTFESRVQKNLFIAGECLDIDALTGGFNFQAAWTGGWTAGRAMAERPS